MAVRGCALPKNVSNGVAGLDSAGRASPSNLPITRAAVLQAAQSVFSTLGGSLADFMAKVPGPDDAPANWAAAHVRDAAPAGGVLAGLVSAYLVGLGQSQAQAATSLATIYSNAAGIAP